ncbi:MAG: hypothetical protein IT214_04895 [Chitinophagaceae bacterium]|jgi:hypothetical protein|nr:hypothetical protein [Chitinophagaceae bacterium]OQY93413.1 MAG: hypothetical protein B6D37_11405 [Sphingobacteriales bacterium UTBCD1]
MIQDGNILKELADWGSSLASEELQNVYKVPEGYFDGLANEVINRIKANEAKNANEELSLLSPFLFGISKQIPYSLPSKYFEEFEENILNAIRISKYQYDPEEELATLSPLLSGLSKQMPFEVPDNYFENISSKNPSGVNNKITEPKVIPIAHRKWFRYAAAASVISFIAIAGLLFEYRPGIDPGKNPDGWIAKNIKKISTNRLDTFISLANEELPAPETIAGKEERNDDLKELLKDIPESQIQEFINETAPLKDENSILN